MDHLPPQLQKYLATLADNQFAKARGTQPDAMALLLATSGMLLNWVGDWLSDARVAWEFRKLPIDDLVLTGTNPEWNAIVIDQAERDPKKLRLLFQDPAIRAKFDAATFRSDPILIRAEQRDEGEKLLLLDGMNRTIAAIRDGITEVDAWIGRRKGASQAQVEAHVVYDLLRAHEQGRGSREDLVAALKFLRASFGNVDELLRERFGDQWLGDEKMKQIVREALA